jgi:hypothetical protein
MPWGVDRRDAQHKSVGGDSAADRCRSSSLDPQDPRQFNFLDGSVARFWGVSGEIPERYIGQSYR